MQLADASTISSGPSGGVGLSKLGKNLSGKIESNFATKLYCIHMKKYNPFN